MKPQIILDLEKHLGFILTEDQRWAYEPKTYCLNDQTQVVELNLYDCNLQDASFLQKMTNLARLDLDTNNLTDITVLGELKQLKKLNLGNNALTNISALNELKLLENVDLSHNPIEDFSCINALLQLKYLYLTPNQMEGMNALQTLTQRKNIAHDCTFSSIFEYGNKNNSQKTTIFIKKDKTEIKYYTDHFYWYKQEGDFIKIGLNPTGDYLRIHTPYYPIRCATIGEAFKKEESTYVFEIGINGPLDIWFNAPFDMEIVAKNPIVWDEDNLNEPCEILETDPYGESWLILVKPLHPEESKKLFDYWYKMNSFE